VVVIHEQADTEGKMKQPHPQLAMPLFSTTDRIDPKAVVKTWAKLFPHQPALKPAGQMEGVAEYAIGDRTIMAVHLDAPVPTEEALTAVASSWMWQEPSDSVRKHRAHAIVTAAGTGNCVQRAWDVARLSAAMLFSSKGVALYWGNSRQVHTPKIVADFAAEEGTPPVPLWVGITISAASRAGPFSAAPHGLEALGHKELEVLQTRMGIGDLRMTLLNLAGYVLEKGPVLLDGETFGSSKKDRWPIQHQSSKLVEGRDVIFLGIP
jgi:hypothetical protein